jgi:hypothetical protein
MTVDFGVLLFGACCMGFGYCLGCLVTARENDKVPDAAKPTKK